MIELTAAPAVVVAKAEAVKLLMRLAISALSLVSTCFHQIFTSEYIIIVVG
jgi:hypothetical protein